MAFILSAFGITGGGLSLFVDLMILLLVALWLSLVYWTYTDAQRRIRDPLLIVCATLTALFPYFGTLIYLIVRPPESLIDAHERRLEIQAAEARLAHLQARCCPRCNSPTEREFLRCPNCLQKLKDVCGCKRPIDPRWSVCPYCEAEIDAVVAPVSPRRRRVQVPAAVASGTDQLLSDSGPSVRRRAPTKSRAAAKPARNQ